MTGRDGNGGPNSNRGQEDDVVRQTVVPFLEAPRLRGITTKDFVRFKKKREIYEVRLSEKNRVENSNTPATSYKASIDKLLLKNFLIAKWVDAASVEDISEESLKKCVEERAKRADEDTSLHAVNKVVGNVYMDVTIKNSEDRIWDLMNRYTASLENAGIFDLPETRPHVAIKHILKRVQPKVLKTRMKEEMKWQKSDGKLKNDFGEFMRELVKQSKKLEDDKKGPPGENFSDSDPGCSLDSDSGDEISPARKRRAKKRRNFQRSNSQGSRRKEGEIKSAQNGEGSAAKRAKRIGVKCLNPECGENHYVRFCRKTSDEQKKCLLRAHRAKRNTEGKAKGYGSNPKGSLMQLERPSPTRSVSVFTAVFCKGAVESVVLIDQGSTDNVVPARIFELIAKAEPQVKIVNLPRAEQYSTAVKGGAKVHVRREVCADIELRVRHGAKLLIRGVEWKVSDEDMAFVVIGNRLLKAMGIDNDVLISAVMDRHDGVIDAQAVLSRSSEELAGEANAITSGVIHSLVSTRFQQTGTFHSERGMEQDMLEDSDVYIDLGEDSPKDLDSALEARVQDAQNCGLSKKGAERLRELLGKHKNIFRIRLGASPPAKVPPMKIRLVKNCRPVKAKARRYSGEQRAFLTKYIDKLIDMGFVVMNPRASWQAAPLMVPKPGSKAKFRLAIDLRPVNSATIKEAWPMPHIDSEVYDFAGSKVFAVLDFVSGYWQLPVDPESWDSCGIVTPRGTVSSTRVLPGLTNATSFFQISVEPLFQELRDIMKSWLDDFNLHAKSEDELLDSLKKFFSICSERGLFLSALKCCFFARQVRWCGRIISEKGVRLDPAKIEGLKDWKMPVNAGELCQFIHCMRWMSIGIPAFAERIAPLSDVLEEAYARAGKRKKRAIKNIALRTLSWGADQEASFLSLQDTLRNAVDIAYPDKEKVLCVYTDASDRFWSAVVTQTGSKELSKPREEQEHFPMGFLGAEFKGAERDWTTFEKEAFAIFQSFVKMDYLFLGEQPVHVFTDHRNLLFVFAPFALEPALGRHVVSKVQRWALFLSRFNYRIEHVSGEENVFADILTRWLKGYRDEPKRMRTICSLVRAPAQIIPTADDLVWPDIEAFANAQRTARDKPRDLEVGEDKVGRVERRIWIPVDATELILKVLVVSHCGAMGHRGRDATESIVRENFQWASITIDVHEFVQGCIHCISSRSGEKITRPLAHALHGTRPNEVVHCDYLYMGDSTEGKKYVLVLRDDLSSYVWLWPADAATSECAVDALKMWIGSFGSMEWLVSDQGSHFKNEILQDLANVFRIGHHFTTAYSPWANGSVERVCREVIRACQALLGEWRLAPMDWPAVSECVQSVLNQSPLKRLGPR